MDVARLTRCYHGLQDGGDGSVERGKAVLALGIVEMLLERGISVVLFDRKGDLASYAVDEAWQPELKDPEQRRRRDALRLLAPRLPCASSRRPPSD